MVICLLRGANDLHMVQLMPLPPHHLLIHGLTFLVPAYPVCPGKEAVNLVSVCPFKQSSRLKYPYFWRYQNSLIAHVGRAEGGVYTKNELDLFSRFDTILASGGLDRQP